MMTLGRKILGLTFFCVAMFFGSLWVYLKFNGKTLIERKVGTVFHRPVSVGSVEYLFPFGIHVTDINVDGLLFVSEARATGGLDLLKTNRWGINEVALDQIVLTIHQKDQGILHELAQVSTGEKPAARIISLSLPSTGVIKKMVVTRGKIFFPSHKDESMVTVSLCDVQLTAFNVSLTNQDLQTPFAMTGRILDGEVFSGPNKFQADGWLNWRKRDLQAKAQVTQYRENMNVFLAARSQSNQLRVEGKIHAHPSKKTDEAAVTQDVLSMILQQAQLAVDLNFSFTTLLDQWELRNIDFSGNLSPSVAAESAAK